MSAFLLYDLVLEMHHGPIQQGFTFARALAIILNHPVIVRGNDTEVTVTPEMSDADCARAYTAALERSRQSPAYDPPP